MRAFAHPCASDYSHRNAWVIERLAQLSGIFSIDVCADVLMGTEQRSERVWMLLKSREHTLRSVGENYGVDPRSIAWLNSTTGWSGFGAQVVRGAVGSAVTQGVSVAAGLQKEFSWSQVAASAAGSGAGYLAGNWLNANIPNSAGGFNKNLAIGLGS